MSDSDETVTLDVADAEKVNRLIGEIHHTQEVKQYGMVHTERINQAIIIAAAENPDIVKEIVERRRYK